MTRQEINRRRFLKLTGLAGGVAAATVIGGCSQPAPAPAAPAAPAKAVEPIKAEPTKVAAVISSAPKTLQIIQATGQVDKADVLVKQQVAAWASKNGFTVNLEIVNFRAIRPKIAAAMAVQSGPDLMMTQDSDIFLNAHSLIDVTPTVEKLKKQFDGVWDAIDVTANLDGKYLGIPFFLFPQVWNYRTDWFAEVGYKEFPKTMDELTDAGKKLKAKNHPIGVSLASANGDARSICYSILWNFGAKEVDETGKKVVINSPETAAALKWAKEFFEVACDPTGYAWDGGGNNRAFLAKTISATNNSPSIYPVAVTSDPELAKNMNHAVSPKGPGGGWFYSPSRSYSVARWCKQQEAAQDLAMYLMQPEQCTPWMEASNGFNVVAYKSYSKNKLWENPILKPIIEIVSQGRMFGYAYKPNALSSMVWDSDAIVNMFSQVKGGTAIADAIVTCEKSMKQIYE